VKTYVPLLAGCIENWKSGQENLRAAPYFTARGDGPAFNRLFAALYDLIFSKLTNMGRPIPSAGRTLKEIFKEKIYGTDKFLVSAELIGYLKWLIYVAAFKDRGGVPHEAFYTRYVARLNLPESNQWRGQLFLELQGWYEEYKPSKRRKTVATACVVQVGDIVPIPRLDNFVDPLDDPELPGGRGELPGGRGCGAGAAAAAAAAPGGGGAPPAGDGA